MLKVYTLEIQGELSETNFCTLASFVSQEKRERIGKFRSQKDAQRSLLGDVLARYAICENLSVPNCTLEFHVNKQGKPFVNREIEFNISHSGRHIVCAVSVLPVGIDVELLERANLKIADRFFYRDEVEYILKQKEEMRNEAFFQIWTKKESYVKMLGKGFSIPLNSFSVLQEEKDGRVFFFEIEVNGSALCHVCTSREDDVCCQETDVKALLSLAP